MQSGNLQRYLLLLVLFAITAGVLPWLGHGSQLADTAHAVVAQPAVGFAFVLVWAIAIIATLATVVLHARRFTALLLLGAVGLSVSLAFVYFSAPDLALTQVLVEVATLILMMLSLRWLPAASAPSATDSRARRWRDALVAGGAGLGVAALAWAVLELPFDSISPYYLETTRMLGGGANAVNVIIVDYRGFDTMGEITVMAIAALIVHALLLQWLPRSASSPLPGPGAGHPLMLALASRLLLPLAAMVSIYLFLRGHNLPGGGFIAGLVLAIALIMQFVANGYAFASRRTATDYHGWIAAGLLIAGSTGIASWWFEAPFLTSTYDYPVWPLVGAVPLASASLFDLGVYLTVVGATMVMLLALSGPRASAGAPGSAQ